MNIVCIMCPMGCMLSVKQKDKKIIVSGNSCKRGIDYGIQEFIAPKRVVTSLVQVEGGGIISVKTNGVIDKADIFNVLEALKEKVVKKPISIGDVVISNVLNSGIDIIATSNFD